MEKRVKFFDVADQSELDVTLHFKEMLELDCIDDLHNAMLLLGTDVVHRRTFKQSNTVLYAKNLADERNASIRQSTRVNQNVMAFLESLGLELEPLADLPTNEWTKVIRGSAIVITQQASHELTTTNARENTNANIVSPLITQ